MKTSTIVALAITATVAFTSCSRNGTTTYKYLREVGRVRQLYNSDARERIPADMRGRYPVQMQLHLTEAAQRIDQYKQTLIGLPTDGVDPEAIQFTSNLEAFLDSVKAMYSSTSSLIEAQSTRHVGPDIDPIIVIKLLASAWLGEYRDTAEDSIQVLETIQRQNMTRQHLLAPFIEQVRTSQERVAAAREALHEQAAKTKADFTKRFPDNDWTLTEILPQ